MKQFVKAICIVGISLMMLTPLYAGNAQKKNFVAKYPQCQTKLEAWQAIDKEVRETPAWELESKLVEKKVAAWKAYKQCEKEQRKVEKDAKDFNSMKPADQTELQQQLNTVKPQ
jgi:protein-disulfide isomerase